MSNLNAGHAHSIALRKSLCDLRVPGKLAGAFCKALLGNATPKHALTIKHLLDTVTAKNSDDKKGVLSAISKYLVQNKEHLNAAKLQQVHLELACEFQCIGLASQALCNSQIVLSSATSSATQTTRRAHNIAAACLFRTYEFERSCDHLMASYKIAQHLNDGVGKYAVLANAVAMLETIGAINEAKELSRYLLNRFADPVMPASLKFQIAINGALLCADFGNDVGFDEFHSAARSHSQDGDLPDDWRSIFAYNNVHALLIANCKTQARQYISNELTSAPVLDSRVLAYLLCGEAKVNLAYADRSDIIKSRRKLRRLLRCEELTGYSREHLLKTLVQLYGQAGTRARKVGLIYLRMLREHLITTKHRRFFENQDNSNNYRTRANLQEVRHEAVFKEGDFDAVDYVDRLRRRLGEQQMAVEWNAILSNQFNQHEESNKQSLRSGAYFAAESWAVAGEMSSGGTGRHCFQIGRVAAVIARRLGWPDADVEMLELACRLHDIGNAFLDGKPHGFVDPDYDDMSRYYREHTIAGQQLLGASVDNTLQMSSKIAGQHHEWWNGCGYPAGLAGAEIALESRICALADCFVRTFEAHGATRSAVSSAARQVVSMAGVQLDPNLVGAFLAAIDGFSFREELIGSLLGSEHAAADSIIHNTAGQLGRRHDASFSG